MPNNTDDREIAWFLFERLANVETFAFEIACDMLCRETAPWLNRDPKNTFQNLVDFFQNNPEMETNKNNLTKDMVTQKVLHNQFVKILVVVSKWYSSLELFKEGNHSVEDYEKNSKMAIGGVYDVCAEFYDAEDFFWKDEKNVLSANRGLFRICECVEFITSAWMLMYASDHVNFYGHCSQYDFYKVLDRFKVGTDFNSEGNDSSLKSFLDLLTRLRFLFAHLATVMNIMYKDDVDENSYSNMLTAQFICHKDSYFTERDPKEESF